MDDPCEYLGCDNGECTSHNAVLYCQCFDGYVGEKCGKTWWRNQMEAFSALLALCGGNSPVTGEFPAQRPVTPSFDVFFDLYINKRLSKQSWDWWFETPSCPLCRHWARCLSLSWVTSGCARPITSRLLRRPGPVFLSLARSKLRLWSANHRTGYFINLACDWLSIVWAYSEKETENEPQTPYY